MHVLSLVTSKSSLCNGIVSTTHLNTGTSE